MDLLELTCPNCDQALVLDSGFAGGVCRCSNCGTLMTVPEAEPPNAAASTQRPERPDSPLVKTTLRPAQPKRHKTRKNTGGRRTKNTSRTGRSKSTSPTQKSRNTTRLMITGAIVSISVIIAVVSIVAIKTLYEHQATLAAQASTKPDATPIKFEYNPKANPFTLSKPNFMGLPLSLRTLILVDASTSSRPWLGLIKDLLRSGTNFDTKEIQLQVIFLSDDYRHVFPQAPTALQDLPRSEMRRFLNGILATGASDPFRAVGDSLATEPEQLILVTSQKPSIEQVQTLGTLFKLKDSTRFDAVLMGPSNTDLAAIADNHGGRCIVITPQELSDLRYQLD